MFPEPNRSINPLCLIFPDRGLGFLHRSSMNMLFSRGGQQQQQQQQQQGQPPPSPTTQSWYPPSVATPAAYSAPSRSPPPLPQASGVNPLSRQQNSNSGVYPPSTTGSPSYHPSTSSSGRSSPVPSNSVASLSNKSSEELTRLLNDRDAYNAFLRSLDEVKRIDKISDDARKSTIDDSSNNLAKESEIAELRTQCMIIRNTELAASREKFEEVEKRYREVQANCSPPALLHKLQDAANEADEESENLHRKFLAGEIELVQFIQQYRKQRVLYHRRLLIRLAALTSMTTPG